MGEQRRSKEVLEDIDNAVDELKQCERILICTAGTEKESV